jgi:ubiquitin C-terminal hydrolase
MDSLPRILILNKNCYTSLPDELTKKFLNLSGTFYNKLLLIDLKKADTYCIFFIDNKGNVRQGYLKINKNDDNEIIKKFMEEEPLTLLKELNIEISDYTYYGKNNDKFYLKIFNININNFFKLDLKNENPINAKTSIIPKIEIGKINNNGLEAISETEENKAKTLILKMKQKENKIKNTLYVYKIPISKTTGAKKKIENNKNYFINSTKSNNEDQNSFRPKKSIIKRNPSSKAGISRNRSFGFNIREFLPNKSFHKETFLTPGLVGLQNSGGLPFLNAILQNLSNIGRLRIHLLNKNIYENLKNSPNRKFSFSLAEILYNIWEKPSYKFFSPNKIKKAIYDNQFYIKNPNDLITFLLENIHKELNDMQNNLDSLSKIKFETNNIYLNSLYNNYIKDFFNKNSSIIVDEFYGFIANEIICEKCSNISYEFEEMKIVSFNLEEIEKYLNKKDINISDCFKFYTRKEINNQETCQNCNNSQSKEIKILNTPKTLIINFDRKDNIEGYNKIVPEEYLDIKKYISNSKSYFFYEFKGIICKDEKGNFIAYCKNSDNCEWYKYNNESVNQVCYSEVKGARLPYALFYNYINA